MRGMSLLVITANLQEEVLHYVMVVFSGTVWQKACSKDYDGIHPAAIVT